MILYESPTLQKLQTQIMIVLGELLFFEEHTRVRVEHCGLSIVCMKQTLKRSNPVRSAVEETTGEVSFFKRAAPLLAARVTMKG